MGREVLERVEMWIRSGDFVQVRAVVERAVKAGVQDGVVERVLERLWNGGGTLGRKEGAGLVAHLDRNGFNFGEDAERWAMRLRCAVDDVPAAEVSFNRLGGKKTATDYCVMMEMYRRNATAKDVVKVMETGRMNGVVPTVKMWNTLIRSYSDRGDIKDARLTVQQMRNRGFSPDRETFDLIRSFGVAVARKVS